MNCYIFDIDGTLADNQHRLHHIQKTPKDWDSFFNACDQDKPIVHMINLCQALSKSVRSIVIVSGRPQRLCLRTTRWLQQYECPCHALYMRLNDDRRPDTEIKQEILKDLINDGYDPIMAFEDRTSVVKMWRANGIPCAQVAEGDF